MSRRHFQGTFVGREAELGVLGRSLRAVRGGTASVVAVTGEAGAGKSRLVQEILNHHADLRVLRGNCFAAGNERQSYAPWHGVLWWLLHDCAEDARPRGRVAELLARLVPDLTPARDALPPAGADELFEAVASALATATSAAPVAVVIEDLQWIDPASRDLLQYVARNLDRMPMLLILTSRPGGPGDPGLDELLAELLLVGATRLSLDPLSEQESRTLVRALVKAPARESDVSVILRRADGNPLFLGELASAREVGALPESLRELLLLRVVGLDADARRFVDTASIIGEHVHRGLLATACQLDEETVRSAARAAVGAGVLMTAPDGRGYVFRHALIRDAVYGELVPDDRVALHRAVAHALDDHPEWSTDIDRVALLAFHWDAAEAPAETLRWSVRAARQASANFAHVEARQCFERARALWPLVADPSAVAGLEYDELLIETADAAWAAGLLEQAADVAREAVGIASAESPARFVHAVARAEVHLWRVNRGDESRALQEAALPLIAQAEGEDGARLLTSYVSALVNDGRVDAAVVLAPRMLEAVGDVNDAGLECDALQVLALCYCAQGEYQNAGAELGRAADAAKRAADFGRLAHVLHDRAFVLEEQGRFHLALGVLDEADAIVNEHHLAGTAAALACLRASLLLKLGQLDEADEALSVIDESELEGFLATYVVENKSLRSLRAGDLGIAYELIDAAPRERGVFDAPFVATWGLIEGETLAWKGEFDRAFDAAARGLTTLEHRPELAVRGPLVMLVARIVADSGERSRRGYADDRAAEWRLLASHLVDAPLANAYTLAIDAEHARLERRDVVSRLTRAHDAFTNLSMPFEAAYFLWRRGAAQLEAGDRDAGRQSLVAAHAAAGAHAFDALRDATIATARAYQVRFGAVVGAADGEPLTAREREVLRLVSEGRSNPEIAQEMLIGRRTVRSHLSNIFRKLGVSSRVEAAAAARGRGIA